MKIFSFLVLACLVTSCKQNSPGGPEEILTPYPQTPGLFRTESFHQNGQYKMTGYYLDGKKEGAWAWYSDRGLMDSLMNYREDKKEGLALEFNTMHQVTKQYFFHSGVLNGSYKVYSSTFLREDRFYREGKLHGTIRTYYPNSNLQEESSYADGKRNGISRWYDGAGNLTIEYEYKNGELIKK